jgi:hypothetical protein
MKLPPVNFQFPVQKTPPVSASQELTEKQGCFSATLVCYYLDVHMTVNGFCLPRYHTRSHSVIMVNSKKGLFTDE